MRLAIDCAVGRSSDPGSSVILLVAVIAGEIASAREADHKTARRRGVAAHGCSRRPAAIRPSVLSISLSGSGGKRHDGCLEAARIGTGGRAGIPRRPVDAARPLVGVERAPGTADTPGPARSQGLIPSSALATKGLSCPVKPAAMLRSPGHRAHKEGARVDVARPGRDGGVDPASHR